MSAASSNCSNDLKSHIKCLRLWYQGAAKDLERAGEAYIRAKEKHSSQAMFNLGYMYERGLGLPLDLHLAKRHYDEALLEEPAAFIPVTLALANLWLRQHYSESFLVRCLIKNRLIAFYMS